MKTNISILRGINVGGHRKILMADLKKMYEKLGFSKVRTYIQSGNVVFQCEEANHKTLEQKIEKAILKVFGHEVPVMVRSQAEWNSLATQNPFIKDNEAIEHLHCCFLANEPQLHELEKLKTRQTENDRFFLDGQHLYILCRGPLHKTPLKHQLIEKTLRTKATIRNWKTVLKLKDL